jgi:hypothetical protein
MSRLKQVTARQVLKFADVLDGRYLIDVAVGPSLDPVLLSLEGEPDYRRVKHGASFPKQRARQPNAFRVHYRSRTRWTSLDLPPAGENYHSVQPMPDGEWLLVRGRADDEQDNNAHVYDADGKVLRSFHAGDGIAAVQTSDNGRIWIGYFDEGVFGNTPLGRSGFACLDPHGRPLLRFTDLGADRLIQSMADCYAFNVCSDREAWLYYYTDFPLVRLVNRKLAESWQHMPIRGANGFAVDGERVLLGGSYDHKDRLFLGPLATLKFQQFTPVDESGTPLSPFRAMGRGACLHLATVEALYRVDLGSL